MSQVIRIPDEVYNRLACHVKGFDTPAGVITRLLDYYEGVVSVTEEDERVEMSNISRGEFVRSMGATCPNWNWAWSFINEEEKFIIFGVWDNLDDENGSVILRESWERGSNGRKKPGYTLAIHHIELVENHGYQLKTFRMFGSNGGEDNAKIETIEPKLNDKIIKKIDRTWYAI